MKTKYFFALFAAVFCHNFSSFAQTWAQTTNGYYYLFVATSAAGNKLAGGTSGSHPIFSTDYGNTWHTNQGAPTALGGLASSADGTKLVMSSMDGYIYISTNSGGTWATNTSAPHSYYWYSLACSADGSKLIGATDGTGGFAGGLIYVSTNSGSSWSAGGSPTASWACVASSADGTRMVSGNGAGDMYISTNFGATWTETMSNIAYWSSVACSADGKLILASGSATYISTNFGHSWRVPTPQAGAVAASANGEKLAIAGDAIYTSTNSGVTWISNNAPEYWTAIASSADGSELVAANESEGIWMGRTVPSPQMKIASTNNSLAVSWLIPSTNFVLQQNSDLTTANWSNVTNAPVLNLTNLQYQVTLPAPGGNAFYRLTTQ